MSLKINEPEGAKLPSHFVTFVEIFFGVVLGGSLLQFNRLLFPPDIASPTFWALVAVYITAGTSWFGWRQSTIEYPYTNSRVGRLRSVLDAVIVAMYAALLFFSSLATDTLVWYLWGFALVFGLYFTIGKLRRLEHGAEASKIYLIERHGAIMLGVAIAYMIVSKVQPQASVSVIWAFVFLPLGIMISFRWFREWRRLPKLVQRKGDIVTIAVDLDGVLVEQVVPVLEKLKKEKGNLNISKCDINDWEYPIEETNIKVEIERAEREEEFVRQMPPMEGAIEALQVLSSKFNIIIATSREQRTDPWSCEWLNEHNVPYNKLINTRSGGKALPHVDILVDDYVPNIERFIESGPAGRQAILFAQPWNCDIGTIRDLVTAGKVKIAHSWQAVLALLASDLSEKSLSREVTEAVRNEQHVELPRS